jgi:hypothetical protein
MSSSNDPSRQPQMHVPRPSRTVGGHAATSSVNDASHQPEMYAPRPLRTASGYTARESADDTTPIEKERFEWARSSESPFDQRRLDLDLTLINGRVTSVNTVVSESPSMSAAPGAPPSLMKIVLYLHDGEVRRAVVTEDSNRGVINPVVSEMDV